MPDYPILTNSLPEPGVLDNTNVNSIEERAVDMNEYNSANEIVQRYAVVTIKHAIIFPVENQDELDAFNALDDGQKLSAYKSWLGSIQSYPPF